MSARDRADVRFRAAVYDRWGRACFRCGVPASEVAHIIRRGYARTRCDVSNARPLCSDCHREQTEHRWEWVPFLCAVEVERLWNLANDISWKIPWGWWESMPCDTTPVTAETGREQ